MRPQPFVDPSLAPHVPRGANPIDMVLARSANGTLGSLNQATGQWLPSVLSLGRAAGPAGLGGLVPFVSLGVGIFNGVMSWKINQKLNHLTSSVDALALRQEIGFRQVHDSLGQIEAAIIESHHVLEATDLRSRQYEVLDAASALRSTASPDDARDLIEVSRAMTAKNRSMLDGLGLGALERFPYVMAQVQGQVAQADARYVLAETQGDVKQAKYAMQLREDVRRILAGEMRDALRENSVKELLEPELLVPVAYWHAMQGLDTAHLITDGSGVIEGKIVWDEARVGPLRESLSLGFAPASEHARRGNPVPLIDNVTAQMAIQGMSGMPRQVPVPRVREVLHLVGLPESSSTTPRKVGNIVRAYPAWIEADSLFRSALGDDISPDDLPPVTLALDPDTHRLNEPDWIPTIEAGLDSLRQESPDDPVTWADSLYRDASSVLHTLDPRLEKIAAHGVLIAAERGVLDNVPELADAIVNPLEGTELSLLGQLALGRTQLARGEAQDAVFTLGTVLEKDRQGTSLRAALPARDAEEAFRATLITPALDAARGSRESGVPTQYYRAIRQHAWATGPDTLECRFFEELGRIESSDDSRRRDRSTKELRRHLRRAAATGSGVPAEVVAEMETARARLVASVVQSDPLSQ